jgi:hypothetical protein
MEFFKPTLNKTYFTFILLFSSLLSWLFWYLPPLDYITSDTMQATLNILSYSFFQPILTLIALFNLPQGSSGTNWQYIAITLRDASILPILASYFAACIVIVWLTRFWKRKLVWQPTFSKTVLTMLFALIFFIAGLLFLQNNTGTQIQQILFPPSPSVGVDPCPQNVQFAVLCYAPPNMHDYVVISIIALTNACLSYIFSCVIVFLSHKLKKQQEKR